LLAGLVNIRGELHLCVRLAQVLGVQPDASSSGRLLVVQREVERWVFPVDEVDQVHRFPARELTEVPATVARAASRLTRGVFTWQGRAIGYLDDERLFQSLRTRVLR
jgi:chemotaxis-related protein WspD